MRRRQAAGGRSSGSIPRPYYSSPRPGTNGNLGLQTNTAPGQRNLDLSLFKAFHITERFSSQFRAEAFNLVNTPQWSRPGNNVQNSDFGVITSTQAEVSAVCNWLCASCSNLDDAENGHARLGARGLSYLAE